MDQLFFYVFPDHVQVSTSVVKAIYGIISFHIIILVTFNSVPNFKVIFTNINLQLDLYICGLLGGVVMQVFLGGPPDIGGVLRVRLCHPGRRRNSLLVQHHFTHPGAAAAVRLEAFISYGFTGG